MQGFIGLWRARRPNAIENLCHNPGDKLSRCALGAHQLGEREAAQQEVVLGRDRLVARLPFRHRDPIDVRPFSEFLLREAKLLA